MTTEWINKYQPKKINDLITNTTAVKNLGSWLGAYEKKKREILKLKAENKQKKKRHDVLCLFLCYQKSLLIEKVSYAKLNSISPGNRTGILE